MKKQSISTGPRKKKIGGRKLPNTAELKDIYRELMKKPNVVGCYVGKKTTTGKKGGGVAIVCAVKDKIEHKDLKPEEVIPKTVDWLKSSSSPKKLKTDVVKLPHKLKRQAGAIIGAGDKIIRLRNNEEGSIGLALSHPELGPVVTTAGHLFNDSVGNEIVEIQSGASTVHGKMVKKVMEPDADYALIRVDESPNVKVENLFRDLYAVGPLYMISENDLEQKMSILTPRGEFEVTLKGIHGQFTWDGVAMTDLILTTWGTVPGDSGSCLVTGNYAVCGLLVGQTGTQFSAFAPAYIPVLKENSNLI
jgi:hypothetical protein